VTGNYRGKVSAASVPRNVRLMGFLSEENYWGLLQACHFVMDLTILKDCLVCGAYEGIAVGKPLILSDTEATKNLFTKGCVYVAPTVESIRAGILKSIADYDDNLKEVATLKSDLENRWSLDMGALKKETLDDI
jgi:glycosyltransferase involved in cell wall biosynthesis